MIDTRFSQLYRKDILSFKNKFTKQYIHDVFAEYGKVSNREKILEIIRNVHSSRMFSFLLLSYYIKYEQQNLEQTTATVIKNLGDAITFLEFYLRKFGELPYSSFQQILKRILDSLDEDAINLYKHYTIRNEKVKKYLEEIGYQINSHYLWTIFKDNPDQDILIAATTTQYKLLLQLLFSNIRRPLRDETIDFVTKILENERILANTDVPLLTLYLHYSAFRKVGKEYPEVQHSSREIAKALGKAIDFKTRTLEDRIMEWDLVVVDTGESRRPLRLNSKFKFYVDEIMATTVAALSKRERVRIVSDEVHEVRVYGRYQKRFSAFVNMLLEMRSEKLNTNLSIDINDNTLILVPSWEMVPGIKRMISQRRDAKIIIYAPNEEAIDSWPRIAGFSERITNFLALPL